MTPLDLVADCLERIGQLDEQIGAWVKVDAAGALRDAELRTRELEDRVAKGPLHGIPVGIKDIVDVARWPTRAGSSLTSDRPAEADATVVARLRAAGAIILGKTVTTEFACFDPPPTNNPWNPDRTPGGSSSGSAAALALGMCSGAIGSQTGGSITRPASYCGVAGIKPTWGLVSRAGVVPVSFHLDHVGPMARSVADAALLLRAMAGPDPRDPACSPRALGDWSGVWQACPAAPRLGVIRPYFFAGADPETAELTLSALQALAEQGAELVDLPQIDSFDHVHAMHRRIMACEAAEFHRRKFGVPREGYAANMQGLIDEGLTVTMSQYQEALEHQVAFRHAVDRAVGRRRRAGDPRHAGSGSGRVHHRRPTV